MHLPRILLATLCAISLLSAVDPDQTFELTFDTNTTKANFAGGRADSPTFTGDLGLRMLAGVNGRNAFSIREGESLRYEVAGNINHLQGTLSLWLKAENYDPSAVNPAEQGKSHKSFVNVLFKDGDRWVRLYLYEYFDTPIFYVFWNSSWAAAKAKAVAGDGGGGGYKLAGAGAATIRQKQWFQLAFTWDTESIRIYLDGELKGQNRLPAEAALAADLKPVPAQSFLGIRDRLWPDAATDVGKDTVVDDVRIWSRPLNALEIRRQYLLSAPDRATAAVLPAIDIQLKGIDDASGDLDRLRVDLDYRGLPPAWQQAISAGSVSATSRLKHPSGKIALENTWRPGALTETKTIPGVNAAGTWTYALDLSLPDGTHQQATASAVRPDTSWQNNGLGEEDVVPAPWTPMTIDDQDRVQVWNRTYTFQGQPFPQSVVHGGDELLRAPPRLIIETAAGAAPITWRKLGRSVSNTSIFMRGLGEGPGFTIDWETSIEFDGMVRCDWRILGTPEVRSMRLEWTVDRRFADFVLDPNVVLAGDGQVSLPPLTATRGNAGIWLSSRAKGFCWAPEHDANWVYERGKDKPVSAVVGPDGGHCRIDMVRGPVRIPEAATYHALFIATPSRPLPTVSRTYRLGGYGRQPNCDVSLEHHLGEGTESVFTFRPGPNFTKWVTEAKKRHVRSIAIYGGAIGLNDYVPEWKWFGDYWAIPGGPCPPFSNKFDGIECMSTAACPRTAYSDYILEGIRRLFAHPDNIHSAIYYDLAGVEQCSNPLHGCSFTDAFGARINRLNLMAMRAHLMRTLKYCHRMGRSTIYHAHSYYHPMVHAFGDYWFPGEQYCSLIEREKTPYVYSDKIPDAVYRSELCQDLKGSGILFLGNLQRANKDYGTEEQTLAMCTKLLLNDVPISMAFEDHKVINRIWGVALRYQLDDAAFTPYYDAANPLRSDNPQVVASLYRCRDGRILAMIGNLSAEPQSATFDLGKVRPGAAKARDEYRDEDLPAAEGRLSVEIPSRQFRIVGF